MATLRNFAFCHQAPGAKVSAGRMRWCFHISSQNKESHSHEMDQFFGSESSEVTLRTSLQIAQVHAPPDKGAAVVE